MVLSRLGTGKQDLTCPRKEHRAPPGQKRKPGCSAALAVFLDCPGTLLAYDGVVHRVNRDEESPGLRSFMICLALEGAGCRYPDNCRRRHRSSYCRRILTGGVPGR